MEDHEAGTETPIISESSEYDEDFYKQFEVKRKTCKSKRKKKVFLSSDSDNTPVKSRSPLPARLEPDSPDLPSPPPVYQCRSPPAKAQPEKLEGAIARALPVARVVLGSEGNSKVATPAGTGTSLLSQFLPLQADRPARPPRRPRKCGICREEGHTRNRCPNAGRSNGDFI